MGKLVVVVGNTGVGKTTLVKALCEQGDFICATEDLAGAPFQTQFSQEREKYALVNQLDFLLRRANEELRIRKDHRPGIQDGGLEEDFHIFTKLFHAKGYLTDAEYHTCERLYTLIRDFLPPPELIVWLQASPSVLAQRFEVRNRQLGIAQIEDMQAIEGLLKVWLNSLPPERLYIVDSEREDSTYPRSVGELLARLQGPG